MKWFSYLTMTIIYSDQEHGFESPWLSDVNLKNSYISLATFRKSWNCRWIDGKLSTLKPSSIRLSHHKRTAAHSDWSKTHVVSEYDIEKACFIVVQKPKPCISYTVIKHSGHLIIRTLEKCPSCFLTVQYTSSVRENGFSIFSACSRFLQLNSDIHRNEGF